jgi:uncharacterized protein YfbU (UPF0304 family)
VNRLNAEIDSLKTEGYKLQHIIKEQDRDFNEQLEDKCLQLVEIEDKLDIEQQRAKESIKDLERELDNKQKTYESQT